MLEVCKVADTVNVVIKLCFFMTLLLSLSHSFSPKPKTKKKDVNTTQLEIKDPVIVFQDADLNLGLKDALTGESLMLH
jgi:hypothetical protein